MSEKERCVIVCYPTIHNSVQIFAAVGNEPCDQKECDATPSEYMKQMLMSTQERHDHLRKSGRGVNARLLRDYSESRCFKVSPCVALFQQYVPGSVYHATLTICNISRVSRRLKISHDPDPFFAVECHGSNYSNVVAPGLSHVYNVRFSPSEKRDYEYRVGFVVHGDDGDEDDVFTVPVIAIGPRPILDIPDRIEVPGTAVKISSSRTILVRNVGDAPAIFSLCVDRPSFSVEPSEGTLEEEETMQLTVCFLSERSGDVEANLFLNYESGEKLRVALQGSSVNCAIRIDRSSIRMEDTYLGLLRSKTLTIYNRSDYIVRFQWMRYKSKSADVQRREEYGKLFQLVRNTEVVRNVNLVHYNVCLPDIHELVCQRIYADEIASLMNENFRYNHVSFLLTPEEGEIWPQSSADITVIFRAMEVGEVSSEAYLEVTGREDRIPLSLRGTGKGPLLRLNVITIDLRNIYLCSVHNYEIVAANKGHISGTLVYRARSTDFGGAVNVTPSSLTLEPDEYKSFNLSFCSSKKGDFVERVDFVVRESLEILSLHIKGCIVCPTLHFDRSSLDFGTVALGFSKGQEVHLRNLSSVPVSFGATMMEDGDQAPLTHEEYARSEVKPSFPANSREFTVAPQKGVVPARGSLKLQIIYTANVVRMGQSTVRVDVWDVDSDPVLLPVSFRSAIPALSIEPTEIFVRFAFLNYPYSRVLSVKNNSDLDGYFCITPQTISDYSPIVYSLSSHQGFLKARQSKQIDIAIITKVLGNQRAVLSMLTMGDEAPTTFCTIVCIGNGPVVSAQPTCLNFGDVQVLQESVMYFRVINDAPIPAQFKLTSNRKSPLWLASPVLGELAPNESTEIEVKIFLRDPGKYTDTITARVANSRSIFISVTAIGTGYSITFEPQIFPLFDMGLLFSRQHQSLPITVKNSGMHHYQILWSSSPEMRVQRSQTSPASKFQVEPAMIEIPANSSSVVQCKICWDTNETLMEDWYLFEHGQGQKKRKLLGTTTFKATFIEPRIVFNKRKLTFRIDMCPGGEKLEQTDELIVTNQSRLDLNVKLYVDPPFYLMSDTNTPADRKTVVMRDETVATITVKFAPDIDLDDRRTRNYSGTLWFEYNEHPSRDRIRCAGAVNFPNIVLPSKDLIISCVLGSRAEERLRMTNNGAVPVKYKFLWAGESIEIQRDARNAGERNFSRYSESQIDAGSYRYGLQSSGAKENSRELENEEGSAKALSAESIATRWYESRQMTSDSLLMKARSQTADKLRSILSPREMSIGISCLSCLEEPGIPTATRSDLEPTASRGLLDNILDIVPHEGTVDPYSSRYVRFIFHGDEPVRVKAVALCEVLQGPTELVNVTAAADTIRYSVDRRVIDFDQQLFGEVCRSSFTLENHSAIFLSYKINERNLISSAGKNGAAISAITAEPNRGSMDPLSSVKIEVEFQPALLGAFEIEFELQVAHFAPLTITAKGIISYPQVYLCIPRDNILKKYPVELEYRAIQSLTVDYIATKRDMRNLYNGADDRGSRNRLPEWEEKLLLSDLWDLVPHEEVLPSVIDVEMAIDRFLAVRFVEEIASAPSRHFVPCKRSVIPSLYTPQHVIDVGYVTIDRTTCYSTVFINYGPWKVKVVLKVLEKKQLESSGILVQFKKAQLKVGETAPLTVVWQPTSARYTDRRTDEQHSFHLEVSRGSTIPVVIRGVVTYPFVTVNTKLLDFQKVVVGECLMMRVSVKNEGFIDCRWRAKITTARQLESSPFHLSYKSDPLPPGRSDVISVYFKPYQTCHTEAKLKINVEMGLETQTVVLRGRGMEHKLRINELDINFSPAVPLEVQERVLTIENPCDQPVEFFWHHLDSLFLEEERVAEALIRYYGVKEILLPPRKPGERMPPFLIEFYNSLMREMACALSAEIIEEEGVTAPDAPVREESSNTSGSSLQHSLTPERSRTDILKEANVDRPRRRRYTDHSSRRDRPPVSAFSELDLPPEPPILPAKKPEEIQNLLLCYIETLREEPDFCEKMRDPVKDLLDSLEMRLTPEDGINDYSRLAKKVCIIFHGAPFTEYQETACRSAKVLRIPLLCIDNVMTEGIALGDNRSAVQLRRTIDDAYREYLSELEKRNFCDISETEITNLGVARERNGGTAANEISPKPHEAIKSDSKAATTIDRHSESDSPPRELIIRLREESAKIPREEDMKFLDPVSLYECKIRAISLLDRTRPRRAAESERDKIGERGGEENQDDTFLATDIGQLTEVLRERLTSTDFKNGFVLQTLNNVFFKNEITTLLVLLDIVEHFEYLLFVTFLNSMENYNRRMKELRELKERRLAEEVNKRIQEIDEMSLSEYELLAEDEKEFYLESTLPIKKQEALLRRAQFLQRMAELRRRKESSGRSSDSNATRNRKANKMSKDRKINSQEGKSQAAKALVNKNNRDRKESKDKRLSEELENIARAMSDYYSNLSVIEGIIKNWDPLRKNVSLVTNSKITKTDKLKDKSLNIIQEERIREDEFHIWYVNSSDPWSRVMYDVVVNQIIKNSSAWRALPAEELSSLMDLVPKRYYILKPRYPKKGHVDSNEAYRITPLPAKSDSAINSADSSVISRRENHGERAKRKRRLRLNKAASKTQDTVSLDASTIESKEDSAFASANATSEETLKSRWILQPNESQQFTIRYRPVEVGSHRHTYALSVISGDGITYDINVRGVADIPRLDMNPGAIFTKIENTKTDDTQDPAYFCDTGVYDFGSLLAYQKNKRFNLIDLAHRCETEFKFRNVSKIDAVVYFHLEKNISDTFVIEQDKLCIPAEQCRLLKISAGVTKLGPVSDKLHIRVTNNPRVDTIELRCSGSKLDVELENKQVSFGQVLLYRREFLPRVVRNNSPVQIFWRLDPDESLANSQISFKPVDGIVKARSDQTIEFCYHASKIGTVERSLIFTAFLHEDDAESVFTETLALSGETYDVAVDINHVTPIDFKCTKVGVSTSASFTITNRGNHEIKYVILPEEQDEVADIAPGSPVKLKEGVEIAPAFGSIQPQEEATVELTVLPKSEVTLRERPILRCHLLDANKQAAVVAKIPLKVSLVAYYTRFRVYPYPEINFASLGVCMGRTLCLQVENIGQFPLCYHIRRTPAKHPSVVYMTRIMRNDEVTMDSDEARKKKLPQLEESDAGGTSQLVLVVGPFAVRKTKGVVQPGEIDTVTIECYPEFVGSQNEQILILVPDSVPEDRDGKLITLSVNSCLPDVDFQNLDAMFREHHIVNRIQDFDCSKAQIGAHTVFARQEGCLYFRHVTVGHTHTACFQLHNRNAIPADVELTLSPKSFAPATVKPGTFTVTPERERVPPTSHKKFTISFSPTLLETCHAVLEIAVELPSHLRDDKFVLKLRGQTCVPEVTILEPPNGKRERAVLNFGRTLANDFSVREFSFRNVGVIPAKAIVEIYEDQEFLFTLSSRCKGKNSTGAASNDRRCIVARLMPEETAAIEVKFSPREVGKYEGLVRLFVADNPYENLTIDLKCEVYAEFIVLEGLELTNARSALVNERREPNSKQRRLSSKTNSTVEASSLPVSLTYKSDYGHCFVNKIYKKNFKIINKSTDRCLRFQWGAHPDVVFTPSTGHLKSLSCKEIVATFLSSEPTSYIETHLDCVVCAIELADPSKEPCWDDRETEVLWVAINSNIAAREQETFARKIIEPVNEPHHEIMPGTTKCIRVLLNAIVAYSEYSCSVKEINFKDTLMFQVREHIFTVSNTGTVDVDYTWQINMDEEYPIRRPANYSRATPRSREHTRSAIKSSASVSREFRSQCHQNRAAEMNDEGAESHRRYPTAFPDGGIIEIKHVGGGGQSDLFSSSAGLTERSSDSWLESDDLPFAVRPGKGLLPPGETAEYILRFSPMDVFDYKAYLVCKMENLHPEMPELVIPVVGRSLLPYCHFDVAESDYLSAGRRDTKLHPGPIDYQAADGSLPPDTRVIEFHVVGVGETHVKRFRMINPTSEDYRFVWSDRTRRAEDEIPRFCCLIPEGLARRRKQVEFAFAFLAENVGVFESFWLFSVERHNLECLFLLVAIVREPSVHCPLAHLRMKPTVLGVSVRESISVLNNEEFPIPFEIARDTLYSEGRSQRLTVEPMDGTLNANGEQILRIEYQPTLVGEFQFAVKCLVKKMRKPLTVFVTATTHDLVVSVIYTDRNGRIVRLHQDRENIVDCGKLMSRAPITVTFEIANSSKMTLRYFWDLGVTPEVISRNAYTIAMHEREGQVISESRIRCHLIVTGLRKAEIRNHRVLLKIVRGPTYRLVLKASATKSFLEFSFSRYDFGPRYIGDVNAARYRADLHITNLDKVPHILECRFEEKPHVSVSLDALSEAIAARSSVVVPITFQPLEQTHYREDLHFKINSTIEKRITITGEGIVCKVRLVNPHDKSVNLGDLPINRTVIKRVPVINDGRIPLELRFDLANRLSGFEQLRQRIRACPERIDREDSVTRNRASVTELQSLNTLYPDVDSETIEPDLSEVLEIEPAGSIVLQPAKVVNVVVRYKPVARMCPFVVKVAFQTDTTVQPLFVLRGSCVGAEFRLNRTRVPFGIVVQGCVSEAKVVLLNIGDVGARFKWNTSKLPGDFSIAPATGYCSPGMNVNFIVSFRPTRHDSLIEGDASLEIEKYGTLRVRITGGCRELPNAIDTLFFTCPVREKLTRSLKIENNTAAFWELKPEIIGDHFTVDEVLRVPPKEFAACTITYAPLVMNSESNLHKAMLLLNLPDHDAPSVYSLQGLSLAPQNLQRITRHFPAKTKFTELLPVYNWTSRQRRFECKIERLDNEKSVEDVDTFTFVGNGRIDVPANNQRDYRAEFHSYKESTYNFKVTFTDQEGEYQFYELRYHITKPEKIESIKLVTPARSPVCHVLRLDNPLALRQIVYTAECQHPYVTIHDVPKMVAPSSNETIGIEYHPVHPSEESVAKLDFHCEELGLFPYELRLRATPAPAEKTTRVVATLGGSVTFSLTVSNLAESNAVFAINMDSECFATPENVEVSTLKSASFDVTYEPCDVDNVFATLTATSEIAGKFVFPLVGTYTLPKPQGPYIVARGAPALIPFKNIFKDTKSFELILDSPKVFAATTSLRNLKPKQVVSITVSLKDVSDSEGEPESNNYPVTGKLLVYCTDAKVSHVNWIYYLRGEYVIDE